MKIQGFNPDWIWKAIYDVDEICDFLKLNRSTWRDDKCNSKNVSYGDSSLIRELVQVAYDVTGLDQTTQMQMASVALVVAAYKIDSVNMGFLLTHHDIIEIKRKFIDHDLVDYNLVSYHVRNDEEFLGVKQFKRFMPGDESRHFQLSSGNGPISARIPLLQDNSVSVRQVFELNAKLYGSALAWRKMVSDFAQFPAGCVPNCEAAIFVDQDLANGLLGARIMSAVNGVRKDFKNYPTVVLFQSPGDIQCAGNKKISAWLCECYEVLKQKYVSSKGLGFDPPDLHEMAIQEAEKVVAHLVQQGGLWSTPFIPENDFDLKYAIATRLTEDESYRLLVEAMLSQTRGVKRYCAVVIQHLDLDRIRALLTTDEQRVKVYEYTQLKALLDDVIEPKHKRICLESDLEL
jgi:hypothetical protein